jgi:hypothetical protein
MVAEQLGHGDELVAATAEVTRIAGSAATV